MTKTADDSTSVLLKQALFNSTYTIRQPPDNAWGAIQSDGTWSGMVRMLQDHIIDIGTSGISRSRQCTLVLILTVHLYFQPSQITPLLMSEAQS